MAPPFADDPLAPICCKTLGTTAHLPNSRSSAVFSMVESAGRSNGESSNLSFNKVRCRFGITKPWLQQPYRGISNTPVGNGLTVNRPAMNPSAIKSGTQIIRMFAIKSFECLDVRSLREADVFW